MTWGFALMAIQERSFVIMLGKWWVVLPVTIIALAGLVGLVMKVAK